MKPFLHCPSCSIRLEDPDGDGGMRCPACARSWHAPYAPTAGAAIVREGKVLVTQRARDPDKGRFDIPGGFLEPGEDPISGLKRELREELGVDVEVSIDDCLQMAPHVYGSEEDHVLAIGFAARIVAGDPAASDDVADFIWATRGELDELDFAWDHDRALAVKALERRGESGT